jgi:hypothetical protein
LAFQAADPEDVASSEIVRDPDDERTQTVRVAGGATLPVLWLSTERLVKRAETLACTLDIDRDGPLHGPGQFEKVSVGRGTHPIRVHPRTVTTPR